MLGLKHPQSDDKIRIQKEVNSLTTDLEKAKDKAVDSAISDVKKEINGAVQDIVADTASAALDAIGVTVSRVSLKLNFDSEMTSFRSSLFQ